MKTRLFFPFLIFTVAVLSACAQAAVALPVPGVTPSNEAGPPEVFVDAETGQTITAICSRSSDEVRLLINSVQGYCLQYPAEYDVFLPNKSEAKLFKRSILSGSEPSVMIRVQPAGEVTLEEAADQIARVYAIPGTEPVRAPLVIDGEPATMLDGLSGQDPNRQVVVLHDDQLYYLTFLEFGKDMPEEYAQFESLYNTVTQSFNFRPGSNACPDCPEPEKGPKTAMISGWLHHDLCDSGRDGDPIPATTPPGCVKADSILGAFHADGDLSPLEPLIEGVVVSLGEGECPSTGLAEVSTITSDLSYSFSGLKAGTYCVSIDPQREPNFTILRPGLWTYPVVTEGIIQTTVYLEAGENKAMVNFGWDYQFQP
jgi:hypothetical protein